MTFYSFTDLLNIMEKLRSETGCPWDREQTHQSLRPYLLEEAHEVLEAIDHNDSEEIKKELGDLLLQVIFHAQIASEENRFDINDVIHAISEKLTRRHPHVFGDTVIKTASEQVAHWEKIKRKEGKKSAIDGVPASLPALVRARRIQQKAAAVGFDWDKREDVWAKVEEEFAELKHEIAEGRNDLIEEEFGDFLFALVNYARFLDMDPESALRKAIEKFSSRFRDVENEASLIEKNLSDMTLEEMDQIWEKIKKKHRTE